MRIVMPAAVDPLDAHIAELEESRPPREHPHDGGLRRGHADDVHGRLARRAERGHGESFRRRRGGWDAGKTHCPDNRTLPARCKPAVTIRGRGPRLRRCSGAVRGISPVGIPERDLLENDAATAHLGGVHPGVSCARTAPAMKPPPGIAQFDSAAAFAQSLARFLHGRDFSGLGQPPALQWLVRQSDLLPRRQRLNFFAGWAAREGISPGKIEMVNAHAVAEWLAGLYPARRYPAVMIGSSNGALVHLCAAFGIPWLPQTFLTVIKRRHDPDDPIRALEQERETAQVFLALNPDVQLHQFFDPNQDRLTLARLAYFRSKFLRLPPAYTQFLADRLEPGGRIIIADCGLRWPTTRLGPRHRFQFGEVGGATVEEYFHGGPRVEAALQRHGRPLRRWQPPPPNGESPEAEWGFEPALGNDLADFARTRGFRLQRISFDAPERPSPLVADFHRSWHRERGLPGNRLV